MFWCIFKSRAIGLRSIVQLLPRLLLDTNVGCGISQNALSNTHFGPGGIDSNGDIVTEKCFPKNFVALTI